MGEGYASHTLGKTLVTLALYLPSYLKGTLRSRNCDADLSDFFKTLALGPCLPLYFLRPRFQASAFASTVLVSPWFKCTLQTCILYVFTAWWSHITALIGSKTDSTMQYRMCVYITFACSIPGSTLQKTVFMLVFTQGYTSAEVYFPLFVNKSRLILFSRLLRKENTGIVRTDLF